MIESIKFGINAARKGGILKGIRKARHHYHWSKNTRW
jgi:hypothetical protein